MAGVGIVIVGLDIADAAVIILKLTLNDKIGVIWSEQIEVIVVGGLVIERDLEALVAGFSDRHVFSVEFHGMYLALVRIIRSHLDFDCQKASVKATASSVCRVARTTGSGVREILGQHWRQSC